MRVTMIHLFAINTLLTAVVIGNAIFLKKQFYPSVVYITRSKPCVAVIGLEAFLCLVLYTQLMIKIFLGELFASERESLREQLWPSVLDSCFTFAIFAKRGEFLFYFRIMCLLGIKSTHFLAKLRIHSMATVNQRPTLFHHRIIGLLLYLGIVDVYQITVSALSLRRTGFSFELLYLFEYSLLFLSLLNIFGEYILECIELMGGENGWEEKVVYNNYLELFLVSIKTILEFVMIFVLTKIKVLSFSIIRNIVYDFKRVKECFSKVVNSLRAISRMDQFPNPTPEDILAESMCSICRDEIKRVEFAKKLFCKHAFHTTCLKAWLRRQQRCPTCRSDVINTLGPAPAAAPVAAAAAAAPAPVVGDPAQNNNG